MEKFRESHKNIYPWTVYPCCRAARLLRLGSCRRQVVLSVVVGCWRRSHVVPGPGYMVLYHFGHLMWLGFPGSLCRSRLSVPSVRSVPHLDVFLVGSVLLVEVHFRLDLRFLVPPSGVLVVFGLRFCGDPGKLCLDLVIEHEQKFRNLNSISVSNIVV